MEMGTAEETMGTAEETMGTAEETMGTVEETMGTAEGVTMGMGTAVGMSAATETLQRMAVRPFVNSCVIILNKSYD